MLLLTSAIRYCYYFLLSLVGHLFIEQDNLSPLYVASHNGHTDTVDILVKEGADVNLANTSLVKVFKSG